jgi:cathepsin B
MRFNNVLGICVRSVGIPEEQQPVHINYAGILRAVSSHPESRWRAVDSSFRFPSFRSAARVCGSKLGGAVRNLPIKRFDDDTPIPVHFDSRQAFPNCAHLIGRVRDQSDCGSCWAFSTTTALEDRMCIANISSVLLSPVDTLSCCTTGDSMGCDGGDPGEAWDWFSTDGVVGETCRPYPFPGCAHHVSVPDLSPCGSEVYSTPVCLAACTSPGDYASDKHRTGRRGFTLPPDESAIKREIMRSGPVSAAFLVHEDFLAYSGGIYHHITGEAVGGHAVKLIGWGEETGHKFWLLVNSWNEHWGEEGLFRMSIDEGGIMHEITAGDVDKGQSEEGIVIVIQ